MRMCVCVCVHSCEAFFGDLVFMTIIIFFTIIIVVISSSSSSLFPFCRRQSVVIFIIVIAVVVISLSSSLLLLLSSSSPVHSHLPQWCLHTALAHHCDAQTRTGREGWALLRCCSGVSFLRWLGAGRAPSFLQRAVRDCVEGSGPSLRALTLVCAVVIWDDMNSTKLTELQFRTDVRAVKLRRDRYVWCSGACMRSWCDCARQDHCGSRRQSARLHIYIGTRLLEHV
jgi:hypothetical protein